MSRWIYTNNCSGSRSTVCLNHLGTDQQSPGYSLKNFNSTSSIDRRPHGTNEFLYGTVPLGVCESTTGRLCTLP